MIQPDASEDRWSSLLCDALGTARTAFAPDASPATRTAAEQQLHRVLYCLYAGRIAVPWTAGWRNLDDARFDELRRILESAWERYERERLADAFGSLPSAKDFAEWATQHCQNHRSNVSHPLFAYLCNQATRAQLREFIVQETPFDIHFGDILAMMLPGVYGQAKSEFSRNFWDEMGRGETALMHRQLRLDMTRFLGEPDDVYLHNVERFCVAELRLANMYFNAVFNRSQLPQAIGMMLATELMVPGRLDQQIMGWRRVGMQDADMRYLLEHTVIDVEHAKGWMDEVVLPMLERENHLMADIVLGMTRRLDHAGAVCDHMIDFLPTVGDAA
jgi:pyrroloquinoline quinone (PQQ) biosynthesis protein C